MFNNVYKNKKILITGHTGFKGSWLSLWLQRLKAKEIVGISLSNKKKYLNYNNIKSNILIKEYFFNINNFNKLNVVVKNTQPDFIFHLAAQPLVNNAFTNPIETFKTNILGTANILESLKSLKKKCVCILITSDKCYRNLEKKVKYKETDLLAGKDPYSASKSSAEILINSYFETYYNFKNNNIRISSVRAGNVIGGGDLSEDRIVPDCIKSWRRNKNVTIKNPHSTRPWLFVLEPLSGYLHLGSLLFNNKKLNGEAFNFGPKFNKNFTVYNLVKLMSNNWINSKIQIKKNKFTHEANLLQLDTTKSKKILNWESILEIDKVAELTVRWYINYFSKKNKISTSLDNILEYEKIAKLKKQTWVK